MARPSTSAIVVENVTKTFERRFVRGGYTTFKTQLVQLFRRQKYKERLQKQTITVLNGVSFEIKRGETVAIIGENGAGKSTMLKLFTGIYKPTTGKVWHEGRISALLELGAGFHPEFSGRENIYMNGMILGLSRKELQAKEQEIIEFSELGEAIDSPVRTYSSGMYMRLAFAIAVNVNPDILIIDEILAVGDEHFQHKSKAKLDEFKKRNIAIVLVTHSLSTVEAWCSRAIWLKEGRVAADGAPVDVVAAYKRSVQERELAIAANAATPIITHADAECRPGPQGTLVRLVCHPFTGRDTQISIAATMLSSSGKVLWEIPAQSFATRDVVAQRVVLSCSLPNTALLDQGRITITATRDEQAETRDVPVRLALDELDLRGAVRTAWTIEPAQVQTDVKTA